MLLICFRLLSSKFYQFLAEISIDSVLGTVSVFSYRSFINSKNNHIITNTSWSFRLLLSKFYQFMQNTKFIEGQDYEFPSSLIEVLSIQKYSEEADAEVYGFSSSHIKVLSIPRLRNYRSNSNHGFHLLTSKFYQFGNHCNHWLSRIPVSAFSYRSFINS